MHIVFVGLSGVPYSGRACDVRLSMFANLFVKIGADVTILNRLCKQNSKVDSFIDRRVRILELNETIKLNSNFIYLLFLLMSPLLELYNLYRINKRKHIDIFHVYSGHFLDFVYYFILAKIFRSKIVYQYVEFRSHIKRKGLYHRLNGFFCDSYGPMLWDGAICITQFLNKYTLTINPHIETVIIPPICSFEYFDNVCVKYNGKYLLYCGSTQYLDVIELVIDVYKESKFYNDYKLILILSGDVELVDSLKKRQDEKIDILCSLSYQELVEYYKGAQILFIPLRNTIQDIARFPNKVCEYSASKGVILTTDIGDISCYFKDKSSALIAEKCDKQSLLNLLNWFFDNLNLSQLFRENAYHVGKRFFDLQSNLERLSQFVNKMHR